jgi:hypothetical protein
MEGERDLSQSEPPEFQNGSAKRGADTEMDPPLEWHIRASGESYDLVFLRLCECTVIVGDTCGFAFMAHDGLLSRHGKQIMHEAALGTQSPQGRRTILLAVSGGPFCTMPSPGSVTEELRADRVIL